jgi:hypothetical protein
VRAGNPPDGLDIWSIGRTAMSDTGQRIVVFFGAGATKLCNGPLTAEILPHVFGVRECPLCEEHSPHPRHPEAAYHGAFGKAETFLQQVFRLPEVVDERSFDDYPPLGTVLSLVDFAIESSTPFCAPDIEGLRTVRRGFDAAIFFALKRAVSGKQDMPNAFDRVLRAVRRRHKLDVRTFGDVTTVLTTNYDTLAENAVMRLQSVRKAPAGQPPSFGCDIDMGRVYEEGTSGTFGTVLKLHGSVVWAHCPSCDSMYSALTERGMQTFELVAPRRVKGKKKPLEAARLYDEAAETCERCEARLRIVMVAPTQVSHRRIYPLDWVWYLSAQRLRTATSVYFVGYGLNDTDLPIAHMLVRTLRRPHGARVPVYVLAHPTDAAEVLRRYRAILGPVMWKSGDVDEWERAILEDLWEHRPDTRPSRTRHAAGSTRRFPPSSPGEAPPAFVMDDRPANPGPQVAMQSESPVTTARDDRIQPPSRGTST